MKNKKIAIITGASRGIGKAIALNLDKKGFIVILVSHNQENLKKALKDFSKNAMIIKADVSKEKDVILMFEKVIDKFKSIDVLINSAGLLIFKEIKKMTRTDFNKIIGTNIGGVFYCMREYIKQMEEKSNYGQIINIGSIVSKTPSLFPMRNLYCSTKAALSALSDSVQAEIQERKGNIKVATIYPGLVLTDSIINRGMRNYEDLKKYALKTSDIVHIVQMIINQSKNSNITEVVVRPINRIRNKNIFDK
ncbi:SDR family oxidoreductase [Patescibacteria group bacterium]|nr:SDR family oxidoreductase [Patescibacteria group bacterium]